MKGWGYGLPVNCLEWVEGGSRIVGDGMVISSHKKVVNIWDRNFAHINLARMTPSTVYKPLASYFRIWAYHVS
ncbi:hypothetical protein Clacol_004661 [Clathrus columnatus]|uniref:Uncharacterized protein n=1 Tax=Clathrus columnatus TaxID=1419009 RepID=A0AAV5AEQ4_9AGAM|nr:hypothetical protein Clacol_004661 [Clathrus columnatus]